ncbi:hypothetical protein UPYG_G00271430 [Umbra pygmaea]|uniref:Uncharacterized protein n=1 Tax=Umbra pygmaea TaxID=75934 RepID=A0ABD0WYJ1_UMBPY
MENSWGSYAEVNSGEMDHVPGIFRQDSEFDHIDMGICQKGCGLVLSHNQVIQGDHCCLDALRMLNDALQERSANLEHEARMERLRWGRREQFLLAQVSSLQSEAQLTALKYQRKLHQYMLNINYIDEHLIGHYKSDSKPSEVCNVSQLSEQRSTVDGIQEGDELCQQSDVSHSNCQTLLC